MCGISGTFGFESLKYIDLRDHQFNRGPDYCHSYVIPTVYGTVALSHNRLSILDLSERGNQPMTSGRYVLTYNGEIYNYREMQSYLYSNDDAGNCPSGNDAWTLLKYIEKFGLKSALQIANGMYAFCLFDAELQQIHLVVDRFGQKPLYYYHDGASFAFASTPAALLTLKDKWKINEDALQSYWILGSVMGEDSLWDGIKKVTGSHHVTYDIQGNTVKVERYWEPKFQENTSGIEDLVFDAINKVKVSDVPIYTFLSGGIDSTLVASQFHGGKAVHLGEKEWPYAKQVADKFGIELLQVNPDDSNIEESLKDLAFQFGEPMMAGLIPYVTAKDVSKFAKVAISANGADELFFGYDRMQDGGVQASGIFRHTAFPFKHFDIYPNQNKFGWQQWVEIQTYVQYDLNKTLDAASMCHSLEVRSPFLDHRLVEMALSIPESVHRRQGNKTILKNMLRKMGFNDDFLNRPKLGFSLHREPFGMDTQRISATKWCRENGFLKVKDWNLLSGRDQRYLEMSCLSFYYWYETWKHKI